MTKTEKNELVEVAEEYIKNGYSFEIFALELGWQEWMNEYIEDEECFELSDVESKNINNKLKEVWDMAKSNIKYVIKVENGFIGISNGIEKVTNFNKCLKFNNFENAIQFYNGLVDEYEYLQILDENEVTKNEKN